MWVLLAHERLYRSGHLDSQNSHLHIFWAVFFFIFILYSLYPFYPPLYLGRHCVVYIHQSVMATRTIPIDSYDTALCIIPPKRFWPTFNRLRALYDKAYEKWPPHINLVYPFVRVEDLPEASASVASQMNLMSEVTTSSSEALSVRLDAADVFPHRHDNTIFVYDRIKERASRVQDLRQIAFRALAHTSTPNYRMHMTVGQSQDINDSPHKFLLEKASLLPPSEWAVSKLYILVRERMEIDGNAFSQMKVWGTSELHEASSTCCLGGVITDSILKLISLLSPYAGQIHLSILIRVSC